MQAIGAAGELIVQAKLLLRGWTAGNVNTGGMMNAPAIDLFAAKGSRTLRIAVKTTERVHLFSIPRLMTPLSGLGLPVALAFALR
jgi:Holliday junction resolvase